MKLEISIACLVLCSLTVLTEAGTKVQQCKGENFPGLQDKIKVGGCVNPPCKLRKKTTINVEMEFSPKTDIKTLETSVCANILGVCLPFVGVDGTSACDKIFTADGSTPVKCPLKAGTTYIYKNSFPVLTVYPNVATVVYWSLVSDGVSQMCFEVPAKIR